MKCTTQCFFRSSRKGAGISLDSPFAFQILPFWSFSQQDPLLPAEKPKTGAETAVEFAKWRRTRSSREDSGRMNQLDVRGSYIPICVDPVFVVRNGWIFSKFFGDMHMCVQRMETVFGFVLFITRVLFPRFSDVSTSMYSGQYYHNVTCSKLFIFWLRTVKNTRNKRGVVSFMSNPYPRSK